MSKQQQAKEAQGYQEKPRNCGNCAHRAYEVVLSEWMRHTNSIQRREIYSADRHGSERNQRCGIGGFAIKKTASCAKWSAPTTD